ncbi:MAG: family transcriptional regulator [Rhodocyclales bacterium]|nr:family transcriptional regulator [Rhodocyclales bacterium]
MLDASISTASNAETDPATVLSKALVRTAEQLGLSQARLAKVLGVSTATASRLVAGRYRLQRDSKEWDFAVLLVRLFRSLDSIVGTQDAARSWLNSENLALAGMPVELIQHTEGLVRVVQYLDASRARV